MPCSGLAPHLLTPSFVTLHGFPREPLAHLCSIALCNACLPGYYSTCLGSLSSCTHSCQFASSRAFCSPVSISLVPPSFQLLAHIAGQHAFPSVLHSLVIAHSLLGYASGPAGLAVPPRLARPVHLRSLVELAGLEHMLTPSVQRTPFQGRLLVRGPGSEWIWILIYGDSVLFRWQQPPSFVAAVADAPARSCSPWFFPLCVQFGLTFTSGRWFFRLQTRGPSHTLHCL